MASNHKSTTEYCFDPEFVIHEARQFVSQKKVLFVEGSSDVSYWQATKGPNEIRFRGLMGKENLVDALKVYKNEGVDSQGRIAFCMDRDFDKFLPCQRHAEPYAYYQMCDRKFTGGYNDLECFLISTECFDNVLTNYCGVINKKKIRSIRENIIEIAAIIGSYRLANRQVQNNELSSEPFLYCYRTEYDIDNKPHKRRSEICVDFFLENNLIVYNKNMRSLSLDTVKADQLIDVYIKKPECRPYIRRILNLAADYRRTAQRRDQNEIDYCRGHDLTELLFFLVSQKEFDCEFKSSSELENKLRDYPHDAKQKDSYIEKIRELEVNQFVKI